MPKRGNRQYFPKEIPIKLTQDPLFQDFLDAAGDPLLAIEDARVINANKAALHLLGSNTMIRMSASLFAMQAPLRGSPIRQQTMMADRYSWSASACAIRFGKCVFIVLWASKNYTRWPTVLAHMLQKEYAGRFCRQCQPRTIDAAGCH